MMWWSQSERLGLGEEGTKGHARGLIPLLEDQGQRRGFQKLKALSK